LLREQQRKDKEAARTRKIEYKKEEAKRQKANRARAEEAKNVSKAKKEVKYKTLSEKVVKVPKSQQQKTKTKRTTLAELEARYANGDKAVKFCEKGCGKYYLTSHKCKS
jgi:hypothetical protein